MAPFSAHTPPGRAARRPGNADLRSARAGLRPAHGAWPRGGAAPLSTHTPPGRAARRQGNADLRSAPLRAAQRNHASPSGGAALLSAHTPPGRAARRPGNADLRPVLPVGAGTRWPPASARRIAEWRCGAPLHTYPTEQSGAQARERRPLVGTAGLRPAHGASPRGNAGLQTGTAARRAAAAPPPERAKLLRHSLQGPSFSEQWPVRSRLTRT